MTKIYAGKIPFTPEDECVILNGKVSNVQKKKQLAYVDRVYSYHKLGDDNLSRVKYDEMNWKDNVVFNAGINIHSYSRGRSSVGIDAQLFDVECEDEEYSKYLHNCHVNIFLSDFMEIINSSTLEYGVGYDLKFAFCKRGSNYGLQLVSE